jgi:probable phosphoglycerate mutase
MQTAEAIRGSASGSVQTVDELTELRMPGWQGLGEKEIAERHPVEWQAWCRSPATLECPYIESLSSASARVRRVVSEIGNRHPRQAVALVTHEAIVRLIILTSLGLDLHSYRALRVPNASVSVVGWRHRGSRLWLLGDTSHYDGGELGFLATAVNPSNAAGSAENTIAG